MTLLWTDIEGTSLGVSRAGLKPSGADDLVVLRAPGNAAAVVTQSSAAAAPCLWTRARVPGPVEAVVINAGNANAATGAQGEEHTAMMAQRTADALGCDPDHVLVCSTGVIGVPLPITPVLSAIERACKGLGDSAEKAARAILTTDTCTKLASSTVNAISVAGFAKGSGMIHPNMATMLAFLVSDVDISPELLQDALAECVERSFNAITVDGDTSTNDTVILQTTGHGPSIKAGTEAFASFKRALQETCTALAKAIASDGEGATQLIEVRVEGLASDQDARQAARAVLRSPLVKCAVHGHDPNWGRILGALGAAQVPDLDALSITLAGAEVLAKGVPTDLDLSAVSEAMSATPLVIEITLPGQGKGVAYGCDLSARYVAINAEYTT